MCGKKFQSTLIQCLVCNLHFTGVIPCAIHLQKKAHHVRKLKKSATEHSQLASANEVGQQVPRPTDEQSQLLYCELCDVKTTDLEPMLEHYRCGKHAKNFSLLGVTKKIFDPQVYQTRFRKLDEEIKRRRNGIFRCHQCSLTFRTKRRYKIHLAGKRHLKKVKTVLSENIIAKFPNDLKWISK